MQRIVLFFVRNRNFLLFVFLFAVSFALAVNPHSFHTSKVVSSANFLSGGIFEIKSSITDYFDLRTQNELLTQENVELRTLLANGGNLSSEGTFDSIVLDSNYKFIPARVINNSYSKTKNNLTLNRGSSDSLKVDMGVMSSQGVVGMVNSVSENYASVQSVLNSNSQIVAKFKKSNHFGTLKWDAKEANIVQLIEIPRIANIMIGDTIVTDGRSTIFPPDMMIGTVKSFDRKDGDDYYNIDIQLFTDMTSVKHDYLVSHRDAVEIKELENSVGDAEQ
ncbi:MAG: rod shape-determining protein MreC [Flavobacteriaceae bacterium]|nr:rod shape-determining protein MreC [Flavobacteriaceae bacterium]